MFIADLSIIFRYSRMFCERRLSNINVGFTEALILMYLNDGETVNQETIAKNFMLDKGAIAKTLTKLEEKNLIQRKDNLNNRREKLVTLTKEGKGIFGAMNDEVLEWHEGLFSGLTKQEIDQIVAIINKLATNAINMVNRREDNFEDTESEE